MPSLEEKCEVQIILEYLKLSQDAAVCCQFWFVLSNLGAKSCFMFRWSVRKTRVVAGGFIISLLVKISSVEYVYLFYQWIILIKINREGFQNYAINYRFDVLSQNDGRGGMQDVAML